MEEFEQSLQDLHIEKTGISFKPSILSCYSTGENSEVYPESSRSLRYYEVPRLKRNGKPIYNLAKGSQGFRAMIYERSRTRYYPLLETLEVVEKREGKPVDARFIAGRGDLLKMINLLRRFAQQEFEFNVVRYENQIFIVDTDYRDKEIAVNPHHKKCIFAGYRFEQVVTKASNESRKQDEEIVTSNNASFRSVISLEVGEHKVVMHCEMDCALERGKESLSNFSELKTQVNNPKSTRNYQAKLYKTYYQCKLCGIEKFMIGFRNQGFQLLHIKEFHLKDLHFGDEAVRGEDWLSHVLTWIDETITEQDHDYWRLKFDMKAQVLKFSKITDPDLTKEMFEASIGEAFKSHRTNLV